MVEKAGAAGGAMVVVTRAWLLPITGRRMCKPAPTKIPWSMLLSLTSSVSKSGGPSTTVPGMGNCSIEPESSGPSTVEALVSLKSVGPSSRLGGGKPACIRVWLTASIAELEEAVDLAGPATVNFSARAALAAQPRSKATARDLRHFLNIF